MGNVRTELALWLLRAQKKGNEIRFTVDMAPHSLARNTIVEYFMDSKHDYLLMVDSDTVPPGDALDHIDTLDLPKDKPKILTGITHIKDGEGKRVNVFINHEDVEKSMQLEDLPKDRFKIAGCGASFLLVHREVFEKIPKPWFKAIEFDNGNKCSEDLYFCEQANNAGYEIICDPAIVCKHAKTVFI